jgi:hypothetical protein
MRYVHYKHPFIFVADEAAQPDERDGVGHSWNGAYESADSPNSNNRRIVHPARRVVYTREVSLIRSIVISTATLIKYFYVPRTTVRASCEGRHIGYVRQDDGGPDVRLLHAWIASEGIAEAKIIRADFKSTEVTIVKGLHVRIC